MAMTTEECSVQSLDDILYDLEGSRSAEAAIAEFFATPKVGVRTRGTRGSADALPRGEGLGRRLIARCAADTWKRYETLLFLEPLFPPGGDHGCLIGPACQLIETELHRLLTQPAHDIAEHLVAALQANEKERKQGELLGQWAAGEIPATFGTACLVLVALQRGWEQRREPVRAFLAAHFNPRYTDLLASKQLGACLDTVRTHFRNPACHGKATFDGTAYEQFMRLVLASPRFVEWDRHGPGEPAPDASAGIFHHHLSEWRLASPPTHERPA
jgi:hypothetical protein